MAEKAEISAMVTEEQEGRFAIYVSDDSVVSLREMC